VYEIIISIIIITLFEIILYNQLKLELHKYTWDGD